MDEGPRPWFASSAEQDGARRFAPATLRNRDAIAVVLQDCLPKSGTILEIASGSGEHIIHFAERFPGLHWCPSDPDRDARQSIRAWIAHSGLNNIAEPLALDAEMAQWPIARIDGLLCINMVHISPWTATVGLFEKATQLLPSGGVLYLYGPYLENDVETAAGNAAFDQSLRSRNPLWGLRNVADVAALAKLGGMHLTRRVAMPANNLSLVFAKEAG